MDGYQVQLFESNTIQDLQVQINVWINMKRPAELLDVLMVTNGGTFAFVALLLYRPCEG